MIIVHIIPTMVNQRLCQNLYSYIVTYAKSLMRILWYHEHKKLNQHHVLSIVIKYFITTWNLSIFMFSVLIMML
jgi:hypothetical protein